MQFDINGLLKDRSHLGKLTLGFLGLSLVLGGRGLGQSVLRLELGYELGLLFSHHGVGDVLGLGLLLLSCLEHQLLLELADGLSLFSADQSLLVQQLELVLMALLVLGSRRRSRLLVGHHCLGTLLRL